MPMQEPLETAAALFARLRSETATEADHRDAQLWCARDARHQAAWDAIAAAWGVSGALRADPAVADRLEQIAQADKAPVTRRLWMPLAIAASVMVLVGATAVLVVQRPSPTGTIAAVDPAAPMQVVVGERDGRKNVLLADGSRVMLDSGSAMTVAMARDRRSIHLLRGHAFFEVRKDASRPFAVTVGELTAIAVGTAFDVHLGTARADVVTTEGLVRVETAREGPDGTGATMVPAGMKLTQTASTVTLVQVDTQRETLWTQGRIIFTARCLSDVAAEMNRYSRTMLVVAPAAANISISGVFRRGDIGAFATALAQQGLVRIDRQSSGALMAQASGDPERTRCG